MRVKVKREYRRPTARNRSKPNSNQKETRSEITKSKLGRVRIGRRRRKRTRKKKESGTKKVAKTKRKIKPREFEKEEARVGAAGVLMKGRSEERLDGKRCRYLG